MSVAKRRRKAVERREAVEGKRSPQPLEDDHLVQFLTDVIPYGHRDLLPVPQGATWHPDHPDYQPPSDPFRREVSR